MLAVCNNRINKPFRYTKHGISSLMIENYMNKKYNFELFSEIDSKFNRNNFLTKITKLGFDPANLKNLSQGKLETFMENNKMIIEGRQGSNMSLPLSLDMLPQNFLNHIDIYVDALTNLYNELQTMEQELQNNAIYYYNSKMQVIIHNTVVLIFSPKEICLITNDIQLYAKEKTIFIHVESDKTKRKYKNIDTYITLDTDRIDIVKLDIDKNKLYQKTSLTKDKYISFEFRRNYHEVIYGEELKNGRWKETQITIYYPMDPVHKTTSIITSSNDENVKVGRKIIGANKEILFETDNDDVVINKLDNEQVKTRKTAIYGYKMGKLENGNNCIVKLFLPVDAKIVQPYPMDGQIIQHQKFRCDRAIVVEIQDMNNQTLPDLVAHSCVYDKKTLNYIVGKEIIPDGFNENRNETCGQGIHFHVYPEYCHYWEKSNDFRVKTEQPELEEADESILSSLLGCMPFNDKKDKKD